MMIDRRLLENFDLILLIIVLALSGLGVLNLMSASQGFGAGGTPVYLKQLYWILIGLGIVFAMLLFDYHRISEYAFILYWGGILLLIAVLLIGRHTSGAKRWIDLGFFSLQPSEIVKVLVVLALARYFDRREFQDGMGFIDLVMPGLITGLPFLLILRQPDLGTALHLAFACLSILLYIKIRPLVLAMLGTGVAVGLPFAWHFLREYQKTRIRTFLNPELDPLGAGYHIIQSKIAVGSGQFWGKGFMKGTQSQLRFLPEQHTDFAFSVFAEEWGFIGSAVIWALFLVLIMRGLHVAQRSQDRFGALAALGLSAMIFWQFLINVSMVTGLMPVVGLPMPFISYGGSSLLTIYVAIGLLLNISMRRFMFHEN